MLTHRQIRHCCAALLAMSLLSANTATAESSLRVQVLDKDGSPVPDVVVYIPDVAAVPHAEPAAAVMDQRNTRFDPHILVVQKGSAVAFPNSDEIAHHVYSFSKPNNFVLPLYKGTPPAPKVFEFEGVVTLGCNIHDSMLGYVAVVDTTIFGKTDADGYVDLDIRHADSPLTVNAWSPRFQVFDRPEVAVIEVHDGATTTITLQQALRPAHDDAETAPWNDYD